MPKSEDDKRHPVDPRKAREMAADALGFLSGVQIDIGDDETWELPSPNFLDPKQRKRHREYQRHMKTMDKEKIVHAVTGAETERFIYPYQLDGEDVDEDELFCRALMGDDIYDRFIEAGGVPGQVQVHWMLMNRQMEDRARIDSKSR